MQRLLPRGCIHSYLGNFNLPNINQSHGVAQEIYRQHVPATAPNAPVAPDPPILEAPPTPAREIPSPSKPQGTKLKDFQPTLSRSLDNHMHTMFLCILRMMIHMEKIANKLNTIEDRVARVERCQDPKGRIPLVMSLDLHMDSESEASNDNGTVA